MGRVILLREGERPSAEVERAAEWNRYVGGLPEAVRARMGVKATVLTPGRAIDYSQVTAIKMALRNRLQEQVARTTGQATIIRDVAAYDISGAAGGATNFDYLDNVNTTTAHTWFAKDLGFTKLGVNQALGIFGYVQMTPGPQILAIRFTQGASVPLAQFWLAPLYADGDSNIGYFDPPVVWGPQQSIGVDLLTATAVTAHTEKYHLYGFVCEPPGSTVIADQANLI